MTELKRPKSAEHTDISKEGDVTRTFEFYDMDEMDSFLSQIAEKLKEARRLREKANKIIYVHDSPLFDDDVRHLEELADAIEEEVIKACEQTAKK